MACQYSEYKLTFDIPIQTPTKQLATKEIECEILKDSPLVYEDENIQIVLPFSEKPRTPAKSERTVSNQTSPRNFQEVSGQVAIQEIVSFERASASTSPAKEFKPACEIASEVEI